MFPFVLLCGGGRTDRRIIAPGREVCDLGLSSTGKSCESCDFVVMLLSSELPIDQLINRSSIHSFILRVVDFVVYPLALFCAVQADINIIDFAKLQLMKPELVSDLPTGAKRWMQRPIGYVRTLVASVGAGAQCLLSPLDASFLAARQRGSHAAKTVWLSAQGPLRVTGARSDSGYSFSSSFS